MHGIVRDNDNGIASAPARTGLLGRLSGGLTRWLRGHRNFALFVLLPTLLAAGYLYLIAADQYQTEAHFVVRSAQAPTAAPSGIDQALTMVGGASSPSKQDAMVVADYLTSHDVVAALEFRISLVQLFRRPEADLVSRLWFSNPAPETLLDYYNKQVSVQVSSETGIATLQVRAFRPGDAMTIIQQLLQLSESRVNALNRRNYASAVAASQRELAEAERGVELAQNRITAFRRGTRDYNPQSTGQARTMMVSQLQAQLAAARAQEGAMAAALAPNSPQLVALRARVAALAAQAGVEQSRMSAGPGNVATGLGAYEELQLRQQLAGKQYSGAAAALQNARETAEKQQLFIVRVVDPNMPGKALYPKRLRIVATIFLALMLTYGIGWLIVAGVKEHSL